MKGYSYLNYKSKKLKQRMEELYKPMFLQAEMPKEAYVPKSFTRATVLEALHFTRINWTRLAAEKWRIRDVPSEIILYKEGGEELTYQSMVLTSLETGIQWMHHGLKVFLKKKHKAKENVEVVQ